MYVRKQRLFVFLPFVFGIVFLVLMSLFIIYQVDVVAGGNEINQTIRYVSPDGNDTGNDCLLSSSPCATIQHAVDQADPGDEVRIAQGNFSGSQTIMYTDNYTYTQVVFIDQPIILRGGFSTGDWNNSNPNQNETIIDPEGNGRGITIIDTMNGPVTIEGLTVTGGDYTGLGNPPGVQNQKCRSTDACGGGVYVHNSSVNLRTLQILNNNAGDGSSEGGGIYLWDAWNLLIDCVNVINNVAMNGAGMAVTEQHFPLTILNSNFESNVAENTGGGIHLRSNIESLVTIKNSRLANNIATSEDGGGLEARLSADGLLLQMDSVWVQDNQANDYGFGISLEAAGPVTPEASFSNLILSGNKRVAGSEATPKDAVISINGLFTNLVVDMEHITAADNQSPSFLYAEPSHNNGKFVTITITNTLLSGFDYAFTAMDTEGSDTTIQHTKTLFHDVAVDHNPLGVSPTFISVDPITGNPMLNEAYHLESESEAIDVGYDSGMDHDIDGNPRPFGNTPDIGADEYFQSFFYLPIINKK